jgi:hypothetical protein
MGTEADMGNDIWGWVEIRPPERGWTGAIRISDLVYRQYGMFASLFGVENSGTEAREVGRFRAIAAGRGAPPHASHLYVEERDAIGAAVGETWVLWAECAAIDWDEDGEDYIDVEPPYVVHEGPGPGRRRERRANYLNGGWATLFKLMAVLAEQFGGDNVRLSVWFDQ